MSEQIGQINELNLDQINQKLRAIQRILDLKIESFEFESGTFIPIAADAVDGNLGSEGRGRYLKIEKFVFCRIDMENIDTTGLTAGNTFRIIGLPYRAKNDFSNLGVIQAHTLTFSGVVFSSISKNEKNLAIVEFSSGGAVNTITVSDISSGVTDLRFNIFYETE